MQFGTSSPLGAPPQSSQRSEMEEFQGNLSQPHSRAGVLKPYGEGDEEIRRWSASGAPAPRAPAPYLPGRKKSQVWSPARPRSEKDKKKPPTASRDIRTALAVTGVHELMCGRPHCVGAFASRCVGASSCSALTARTAALLFWSEEYSQQSSQRTCPSRTICTTGST